MKLLKNIPQDKSDIIEIIIEKTVETLVTEGEVILDCGHVITKQEVETKKKYFYIHEADDGILHISCQDCYKRKKIVEPHLRN